MFYDSDDFEEKATGFIVQASLITGAAVGLTREATCKQMVIGHVGGINTVDVADNWLVLAEVGGIGLLGFFINF